MPVLPPPPPLPPLAFLNDPHELEPDKNCPRADATRVEGGRRRIEKTRGAGYYP